MAQNVTIAGASYNNVPAIEVPKQGTGTAIFCDPSVTTAVASDVASGKYFLAADGTLTAGTGSGGTVVVTEEPDTGGGIIKNITVTGSMVSLQGKSGINPSNSSQTITADEGYDGLSFVQINAAAGSAYPWLGAGAEKVGTVISKTINLKDDTTYDSWEASTTATTIKAASATPDYSLSANMNDYDYCFVTRGFVEPVYVSGTPATYRTHRVAQYHVQYYYGYPSSSTIAQAQNDSVGTVSSLGSGTAGFIQYYYNSSGALVSRSATQCGPIYMSSYPSYSQGTVSSGTLTINVTLAGFNAKCDSSRFKTERKAQVDSANTNYYLTVDLYRVPHGNGMASHWISEMCAALNAT